MDTILNPQFWLGIAAFAAVTSFTPGPNNILLLTSGNTFGVARTMRHIGGIALGFPFMILAVGLLAGAVFERWPALHEVLRYVGAAYLLYLTYRIVSAEPELDEQAMGRPISFIEAAAFQWVNPKAWIMATGAISTYTTLVGDKQLQVAAIAAVFCAVGFLSSLSWAAVGASIARLLRTPRRRRILNWALGGLLLVSVVQTLLAP